MSQTGKVSGVATQVSEIGGYVTVVYHETPVIRWNASAIVLTSGGFRTATTKTRMNQASNQYNLGIVVYQEKGKWFVVQHLDWANPMPFFDGMTIVR